MVHVPNPVKHIEQRTTRKRAEGSARRRRGGSLMAWTRDQMAARAAKELRDGFYVNLGIGIPTLVSNYIPEGMRVQLQSENGMLGMGPFPFEGEEDADLINAGKQTITELPTTSYFSSSDSFGMIRGGHIDLSILGAMQVAENGDLANWMIPGKMVKGMGGAMDLVAGVKRVVVVMEHVAKAKDGSEDPKLLQALQPAADRRRVVDLVITDLGVFSIDKKGGSGMTLIELADGVTRRRDQGQDPGRLPRCARGQAIERRLRSSDFPVERTCYSGLARRRGPGMMPRPIGVLYVETDRFNIVGVDGGFAEA